MTAFVICVGSSLLSKTVDVTTILLYLMNFLSYIKVANVIADITSNWFFLPFSVVLLSCNSYPKF